MTLEFQHTYRFECTCPSTYRIDRSFGELFQSGRCVVVGTNLYTWRLEYRQLPPLPYGDLIHSGSDSPTLEDYRERARGLQCH